MKFNGVLKVLALPFKAYPPGNAPVKSPPNFKTFYGLDDVPESLKEGIVRAYIEAYADPPWNESWEPEEVWNKMERELSQPFSCLTVMEGNQDGEVAGFCWGGLIWAKEFPRRVVEAYAFQEDGVEELLKRKMEGVVKGPKVFVVDEIAILRRFRGGTSPIQFLARPIVELAVENGVLEGISWTVWDAKITPLVYYMGLSTIVAEIGGLVFLYMPDVTFLCKLAQNLNGDHLKKIIAVADRTTKLFKRMKSYGRGSAGVG